MIRKMCRVYPRRSSSSFIICSWSGCVSWPHHRVLCVVCNCYSERWPLSLPPRSAPVCLTVDVLVCLVTLLVSNPWSSQPGGRGWSNPSGSAKLFSFFRKKIRTTQSIVDRAKFRPTESNALSFLNLTVEKGEK